MDDLSEEMQRRIAAAINRLQAKHGFMRLDVDFVRLFHLIACLQLALRHPTNTGAAADSARGFIDEVISQLQPREPDLAALLKAGDDPRFDQPVEARPR